MTNAPNKSQPHDSGACGSTALLREALKPLADLPVGDELLIDGAGLDTVLYKNGGKAITARDVLNARAALQSQPAEPQTAPDEAGKLANGTMLRLYREWEAGDGKFVANTSAERFHIWKASFNAALRASPPPGYKMVPVEPTPEMCLAANRSVAVVTPDGTWSLGVEDAKRTYRAMLSASPPAPAGTEWRDIASAPKDGTKVLLACFIVPSDEAQRNGSRSMWDIAIGSCYNVAQDRWSGILGTKPTHWMPLPSYPRGTMP